MAPIGKIAAAALIASAFGLLLRRKNPELSALLGALTAAVLLIGALSALDGLRELTESLRKLGGNSAVLIAPVLKVLAVSIVTRLGAELCRDSGQGAASAGVELAGTLCAAAAVLPLLLSMLKMIGELL